MTRSPAARVMGQRNEWCATLFGQEVKDQLGKLCRRRSKTERGADVGSSLLSQGRGGGETEEVEWK